MTRDQIMQMAKGDPSVQKAVDAMERQLATTPIVPEDLDEAIKLLEFVMQHPDKYAEVRTAAIKDGVVKEDMIPPQFNKSFIVSMLIALYGLQDRLGQKMSHGGLAFAARQMQTGGQGGDTELVHVNRREKEMLKRMGGAGTVNPHTGLHEYKGIGQVLGAVLPVALGVLLPGVGGAIGAALGAGEGVGASILGSSLIGAGASALSGGNVLKGALMGGVSGGLGNVVGNQLGMTDTAGSTVGGGIVGAGANAVTGGNVLQGAGQGALAGALANRPSDTAVQQLGDSAYGVNNAMPSGLSTPYDPYGVSSISSPSATGGFSASQPATGFNSASLSPQPAGDWTTRLGGTDQYTGGTQASMSTPVVSPSTPAASAGQAEGSYQFNPKTNAWDFVPKKSNLTGQILGGLQIANGVYGAFGGGASAAAPAGTTSSMSAAQKAYFNRPSISWDWGKIQRAADAQGLSVNEFMGRNRAQLDSGAFNTTVAKAKGGALTEASSYAQGSGSGRDDTISAKLSDGEYVMDAETVALLGDGSSAEGARRLDAMRSQIREHKGKALAKGKFSPDAKAPLNYLKGVA